MLIKKYQCFQNRQYGFGRGSLKKQPLPSREDTPGPLPFLLSRTGAVFFVSVRPDQQRAGVSEAFSLDAGVMSSAGMAEWNGRRFSA